MRLFVQRCQTGQVWIVLFSETWCHVRKKQARKDPLCLTSTGKGRSAIDFHSHLSPARCEYNTNADLKDLNFFVLELIKPTVPANHAARPEREQDIAPAFRSLEGVPNGNRFAPPRRHGGVSVGAVASVGHLGAKPGKAFSDKDSALVQMPPAIKQWGEKKTRCMDEASVDWFSFFPRSISKVLNSCNLHIENAPVYNTWTRAPRLNTWWGRTVILTPRTIALLIAEVNGQE